MINQIGIKLSSPKEGNSPLIQVEFPVDFNETADLEYTRKRVGQGLSIKQWLMPGLCVLFEDFNTPDEPLPELTISGDHISVICHGPSPIHRISEGNPHLSGIIEVRNAQLTSVPGGDSRKKRVLIIFSRPYFSRLLCAESWIKAHYLYDLPASVSGTCYPYFLELPIRQIINALLSENLESSQKRYYFELKLKELFFLLHLQSGKSGPESAIPADIRRKLGAAKAYLLANYTTAPTIKQLSRIISLNEFWLKQYFKIQFGTTIKSFVTTLRMEEAKSLLSGNHSVNEVAARLGYKNVSHFILIFKRTFGDTPRQLMYKQEPNGDPAK